MKHTVSHSATGARRTRVNLALQGGGAHGAFTWGVLDRLLEEETLEINALSGTSAGAMNAAALLTGLMKGGREEARTSLEGFWKTVSKRSRFTPFNMTTSRAVLGGLGIDFESLPFLFGAGMNFLSPYDLNPAGFNPLREIIDETIDIDAIARSAIPLHVTATHVGSGEARIFSNDAVSTDVLLASACLPSLFHAVEIDGEHYWDGGYTGNPSLMPLVLEPGDADLLLVQTSPTERAALPQDAQQIAAREKEISFNAPLIKELRLLAELQHQAGAGTQSPRQGFLPSLTGLNANRAASPAANPVANLRIHRIAGAGMNGRSGQSKLNSTWPFLEELREEGRTAADEFLEKNRAELGKRSTLDLGHWLQRADPAPLRKAKAS
ncbi:patatin-like phospholipase family protein [uncultured Roseibium sp.]|uniref:patatin-like phospholipase family protein n=1 Tax=uncultured Roseibium sp. TaxID=1936171 RepID=UPI0026122850|nr:patatin-like phospholipase family protein [uncultured Roseibium sp.]